MHRQGADVATITHLPGAAPAHAAPPGPATALLQVDNVSLEYRTPQSVVRATHRVSFDVYQADRFVLLGAEPERVQVTGNLKFDMPPVDNSAFVAAFAARHQEAALGNTHADPRRSGRGG